MCEAEQIVNEMAQDLCTRDDGVAWFTGLALTARQAVRGAFPPRST